MIISNESPRAVFHAIRCYPKLDSGTLALSLVSGSASISYRSFAVVKQVLLCMHAPIYRMISSSVLSGGASPHDVCRRAATFSSHFGMTHCGGKWGLKERSRGLHVRARTGMARESRHSWLESPFHTFFVFEPVHSRPFTQCRKLRWKR